MPKPLEWIGQAPSSIDEFKDTFPHVYGTVFAEAGPRKMPMSEIDWNMLVSGTRCRQSAGTCTAQVTAMMAQGTSSHALSAPAGVPSELTRALTGLTQLLGQVVARQGQAEQDQHCPLVFNDGHLGGQRGQRERESMQGMAQRPQQVHVLGGGDLGQQQRGAVGQPQRGALDDQPMGGRGAAVEDPRLGEHQAIDDKGRGGSLEEEAESAGNGITEKETLPPKSNVDAVTDNLVGRMGKRVIPWKKPAAAPARPTMKRPAAATVQGPNGTTQCENPHRLPAEWTCWQLPRGDKYYVTSTGKRFRSIGEARQVIGNKSQW